MRSFVVLHEEFSKSMFIFFPVLHGLNKTRLEEQNEREREGEGRCESGGELKQHLMEIPTTTERERERSGGKWRYVVTQV